MLGSVGGCVQLVERSGLLAWMELGRAPLEVDTTRAVGDVDGAGQPYCQILD